MTNLVQNFHFLQPWWLLAVLALPMLLWLLLRRHDNTLQQLVDRRLMPFVTSDGGARSKASPWLLAAGWLLATLALAGPAWQRLPSPAQHSDTARVIVLSLADSMQASDLEPNRLTRARFKVRDLLQQGRAANNALVAYAGQAFVVAPLTTDAETVLNFVDALKPAVMPVPGNRTDLGIAKAVDLLQQAGFKHGSVILVADSANDKAVAAVREARQAGMRVSVLGVGTDRGTPVPLPDGGFLKDADGDIVIPRLALAGLQDVARAGGGIYRTIEVGDDDVLALLAATRRDNPTVPSAAQEDRGVDHWRDEGPWLLLLLVPLAALAFRRGWLMMLACVFLLPASPARAAPGWWDALWHNADQRAMQALQQGDVDRARKDAQSPGLAGAAAFRDGDFKAAAEAFARQDTAQARYNLGNALARQKRYHDAIDAWTRALELDPDLADARANRKAVEDWLAQQKKQPKPQKQGDQKQGDQKQGDQKQGDQKQGDQKQGDQKQGDQKQGDQKQDGQKQDDQKQNGQQQDDQEQGDQQQDGQQQGDQRPEDEPMPATAASASREQQRQLNRALGQAMDRAMDEGTQQKVYRLGQSSQDKHSPLPDAMRQALERVPEDPGGLLRRKFMLEYQQRQQRDN